MELERDALRLRLLMRSLEYVRIAVDADHCHARGGSGDRERNRAGAATKIQDPYRISRTDRALDETRTPQPLPHRQCVDGVIDRREDSAASRRDVSVAHVATVSLITSSNAQWTPEPSGPHRFCVAREPAVSDRAGAQRSLAGNDASVRTRRDAIGSVA